MDLKKRKAQSTLEYAVVVACLTAALITMQIYIKRGMQGRFKDAADEIGEQYSTVTTNSSLIQTFTSNVTVNCTPRFINVNVEVRDPLTGVTTNENERREIMEVSRIENAMMWPGAGSHEQTGNLSQEELFQ